MSMKGVFLAVSVAVVGGASAAITSRSYVQGGLVAQYDGINNVGHGAAHSDSAATWVDLTGHGNNGTVDSHVTWGADGWSVNTNCKPITLDNGISAVTATGEFKSVDAGTWDVTVTYALSGDKAGNYTAPAAETLTAAVDFQPDEADLKGCTAVLKAALLDRMIPLAELEIPAE